MKYLNIFFFFLFAAYAAHAGDSLSTFRRHRLTLIMGNTHVADVVNEQTTFFIVPTWGFDYDYSFTRRFSIGLKSDIELQNFEIEHDEAIIQRNHPVSFNLTLSGKVWKGLSLMAGPGLEVESHKNFKQLKLGAEYGIELSERWELGINLIYENKQNYYDTWMFGFGFSRYL